MSRRVLAYGDRALLVEVDTLAEVLALYPAMLAARRPGIGELVPAGRTILVTVDLSRLSLGGAENWIRSVSPVAVDDDATATVTIAVDYSGQDLGAVALVLGISEADVIDLHTSADWRVAFIGFAPGFAYLAQASGASLEIPRRATSRPVVPAGSVGLAGEFSGIYPRESPGGWQLIGTTTERLWDENRTPPALLAPGTRVRFTNTVVSG